MRIVGDLRRSFFINRWVDQVANGTADPRDWIALKRDGDNGSFAYIPIPKAANSTIRTALLPCFSDRPDYDGNIHHHPDIPQTPLSELVPQVGKDTFLFTVVRHPAERILSTYRNKMGRHNAYFGHAARLGMSRNISFDRFLEVLVNTPVAALDGHFKPQVMLLDYALGNEHLTVFRSEMIDAEWPDIAARIEKLTGRAPSRTLGKLNQSQKPAAPHDWTPKQRRLIEYLYRDDFERFGYDGI